jgi:hypothetical protein
VDSYSMFINNWLFYKLLHIGDAPDSLLVKFKQ